MTKKSERFRIREMELEHELNMQREKLLADAFLHPPGLYLLGLGGSAVLSFFGAAMTPEGDRTDDQMKLLKLGLIAALGPIGGGIAGWSAEAFAGRDTNPLGTLFSMAGAGGVGLFTVLLILNEMKPDGSGDGGGALGTLLGAVA
jgi:hypothetical protein